MPSLAMLASLALLPITWALQINNPGHPATGSTVAVSWSHVESDPAKFDLYLWNGAAQNPAVNKLLAAGVATANNGVSVRIPCGIPSSGAYQLFAVNGADASNVYARSSQFSIAVVDCKDPTTTTTTTSATKTSSTSSGTQTTTTATSTATKPTSTTSSHSETSTTSGHSNTTRLSSESTSFATSGSNTTITVPCSSPCHVTTTIGITPTGNPTGNPTENPTGNPTPTTIPIAGAAQSAAQWFSIAVAFMAVMLVF